MEEDNDESEIPSQNGLSNHSYHEGEKIVQRVIEDEMKKSYLEYSMSVIVGRALPDVRDGLKPVHRRILFAMHELGLQYGKPFRKCARIVGEVLGKFHPHGDTAVYDTLVRMAQPFSLRYPLVDGQGNFGSIDGDNQAAMRYTEAKLQKAAEELLEDIEKDTVDFQENFDASLKEPRVLPAKLPNLLINGSAGIAVGMATNIPPQNVGEVIEGAIQVIDNPDIEISELIDTIKGPDFPTGAIICGKQGIKNAYHYGRGRIIVRGKTELEEHKGKQRIIISEVPYMVNKAMLVEQIASLVRDKKIDGVTDLRDESNKEGIRVILELRKNFNTDIVINQLHKYSRLQVTFGVIMLALVDNVPKVLNLKQMISHFIEHRKEVVVRRTEFELKKAEERIHIIEGLIIALNHIDEIITKIKASKDTTSASETLETDYSLTKIQAKAILEMRLQKLSSLEQEKIREEHKTLIELITHLKGILASQQKVLDIIKKELTELKNKFQDDRRTEIIDMEIDDGELDLGNLIEEEKVVITITHHGYIKRTPIGTYKEQKRGGKGVIATSKKDEDFVEDVFACSTHTNLLFFTNLGKVYWLKGYDIPEGSRQAKGKAVINLIKLSKDEQVNTVIPVKEYLDTQYLILATKKGTIKKTSLTEYSRPRRGGIRGINLVDSDELIKAVLTDGQQEIMLATKNGNAIRFAEQNVRPMGRSAKGVKGISLRANDEVVGMILPSSGNAVLTITENGFGKRTNMDEYRKIGRGGLGVINIQTTDRNGKVVSVTSVKDVDETMIISRNGIILRTATSGISLIGRNTQGVRLMRMTNEDKVVAAAKIINEEKEDDDLLVEE